MKKRIVLLLTTGVVFASGVFFWTSDLSSAQEKIAESTESVVVKKLDALVTQLSKLTDLISVKKEEKVEDDFLKGGKDPMSPPGNPAGCGISGVDFESWAQSYYRKTDSDWNLSDLPVTVNYQPYEQKQFIDLNGDGLQDYIYRYKRYGYTVGDILDGDSDAYNLNTENSCVLLNNGHGWDIVYKCMVKRIDDNGVNRVEYYGDCADTSKK